MRLRPALWTSVGAAAGAAFVLMFTSPSVGWAFGALVFAFLAGLLWLLTSRSASLTAGTDGVVFESFGDNWFAPWRFIRRISFHGPDDLEVRGEVILADGRTMKFTVARETPSQLGAFVSRVEDAIHDPVPVHRSDSVDPVVLAARCSRELEQMLEPGGRTYRERAFGRDDFWKLLRDPDANPEARAAVLVTLISEAGAEERDELKAMAEATAHYQLQSLLVAAADGKPSPELQRLLGKMKRKPVKTS